MPMLSRVWREIVAEKFSVFTSAPWHGENSSCFLPRKDTHTASQHTFAKRREVFMLFMLENGKSCSARTRWVFMNFSWSFFSVHPGGREGCVCWHIISTSTIPSKSINPQREQTVREDCQFFLHLPVCVAVLEPIIIHFHSSSHFIMKFLRSLMIMSFAWQSAAEISFMATESSVRMCATLSRPHTQPPTSHDTTESF